MGDQVLTVQDVADELRCGLSAVYSMLRSGELPSFRIGKRGWRVTRTALEAFKAGGTHGSAA